jgi:putative transposase
VFHWGLAQIKATVAQREAERFDGISAEEPVADVASVCADSGTRPRATSPVVGGDSTEAYSSGLANLATALGNWNGSIS